jgi:hypothetical protein
LKAVESLVNKVTNKFQVDVMNGLQNAAQSPARSGRPARLSPEINEFLHMLDALEGQLQGKDDKAPAKG